MRIKIYLVKQFGHDHPHCPEIRAICLTERKAKKKAKIYFNEDQAVWIEENRLLL